MERKKPAQSNYNKKDPYQDATKFFIVYEGEVKEPRYFENFNNLFLDPSKACVLHVFEEDTNVVGSQPKKLIERAISFISNPPFDLKVTPSLDDKFRFVLDVDNHPVNQFDELKNYCSSLPDAELFISNYCFEVWLWLHIDDVQNIKCSDSNGLKTELGEKHAEYKLKNYPKSYLEIDRIYNAIVRAEIADTAKDNYFPSEKSTKVYLLMQELLNYSLENSSVQDPEVV